MSRRIISVIAAFVLAGLLVKTGAACPFCSAVSQTFTEEIAAMDVVVMAELVEAPPANETVSPDPSVEPVKSKFQIIEVIKGQEVLGDSRTIETLFFGTPNIGNIYLIMGADPSDIMWSSPFEISDRAQEYIRAVTKLPAGPQRLEFFLKHLEDKDEVLNRDAYDEFARAPYEDVQKLKRKMDHDQLLSWISDPDVPTSRRRLYLTLLGVCGTADDLPLLEEMLRSDQPTAKEGRDALIACYLLLKGSEGLPLVEELFLTNENAEYVDTYATVMAIRFHGTDVDVVPRDRLLDALRHVLDRPELADLVIADFARWEDWSVMDRLVQLFIDADEQSSWARVPVINYLRACPLPEAKDHIVALEQLDPDAVKRANTFFPFAAAPASTSNDEESTETASSDSSPAASVSSALPNEPGLADVETLDNEASTDEPMGTDQSEPDTAANAVVDSEEVTNTDEQVVEQAGSESPTGAPSEDLEGDNQPAGAPPDKAPAARRTIDTASLAQETFREINVVSLLGLALLLGIILLVVMWLVLRGSVVRTKS